MRKIVWIIWFDSAKSSVWRPIDYLISVGLTKVFSWLIIPLKDWKPNINLQEKLFQKNLYHKRLSTRVLRNSFQSIQWIYLSNSIWTSFIYWLKFIYSNFTSSLNSVKANGLTSILVLRTIPIHSSGPSISSFWTIDDRPIWVIWTVHFQTRWQTTSWPFTLTVNFSITNLDTCIPNSNF